MISRSPVILKILSSRAYCRLQFKRTVEKIFFVLFGDTTLITCIVRIGPFDWTNLIRDWVNFQKTTRVKNIGVSSLYLE